MLWLPVLLAPHPLADDSLTTPLANASALSARQRRNLRAATARDAETENLVILPAQTPRLCGISPFREAAMTH